MNFNKKLKCKLCRTSIPALGERKQLALAQGFSVTVYCTNVNCENHLGGLISSSSFKSK